MKETFPVRVRFLTPPEGGRTRPPSGPTYRPLAAFEDFPGPPHTAENAWSVVLTFAKRPSNARHVQARLAFLVHEAPSHLFGRDSRFELLEGDKVVARGAFL